MMVLVLIWNSGKNFKKLEYLHKYFACVCIQYTRQNGRTDQAQILCGTSHDFREGFCCSKLQKAV